MVIKSLENGKITGVPNTVNVIYSCGLEENTKILAFMHRLHVTNTSKQSSLQSLKISLTGNRTILSDKTTCSINKKISLSGMKGRTLNFADDAL